MYPKGYQPSDPLTWPGPGIGLSLLFLLAATVSKQIQTEIDRRRAFSAWLTPYLSAPATPASMLDQVPAHLAGLVKGGGAA